jgi:hypothetical protein
MKRYSCVNIADWPKTWPTATPRGSNTIKISQTEKSRQLTLSWWSKCYILNNLRVLHHICFRELARGFVKENSLVCEMCNFTHQQKMKKRDSTYIIQNQMRKRNWESGIQPTCTQYPNMSISLYLKTFLVLNRLFRYSNTMMNPLKLDFG